MNPNFFINRSGVSAAEARLIILQGGKMQADQTTDRVAVVMVHGLWMTGLEMGLLARRLRRCGFACHRFPYSSLLRGPEANAAALAGYIAALPQPRVHLVGHSLGGRVIDLLLANHGAGKVKRVLTLGTPFAGSHIARTLARRSWSRPILGAAAPALVNAVPHWRHQCPLGIIAGDRGLGIGLCFPALPRPHDGTVALAETEIGGSSARITVPATHMSMLFNRAVAELACRYLRTGSFAGPAAGGPA
jgi:pimeloyl-ACP methyl ester carboxylesterase